VEAAAMTHLQTGLTIASHTGGAIPAFEEIHVLREKGVDPSAFIWVHAQMESDPENWIKAAGQGTWISLDGVSADKTGDYVHWLKELKNRGLLKKVLVSHDAGWYTPGQPNGGAIRGYADVFQHLIPALRQDGFNDKDVDQIFVRNPATAFRIKIRKVRN
jgi:phosphotriesterase-related protein